MSIAVATSMVRDGDTNRDWILRSRGSEEMVMGSYISTDLGWEAEVSGFVRT